MIFMNKYIPKEKLGKKARRKLDAERRGTWGGISPITCKSKNEKTYNRKKARREMDFYLADFFVFPLDFDIMTVLIYRKSNRFLSIIVSTTKSLLPWLTIKPVNLIE